MFFFSALFFPLSVHLGLSVRLFVCLSISLILYIYTAEVPNLFYDSQENLLFRTPSIYTQK